MTMTYIADVISFGLVAKLRKLTHISENTVQLTENSDHSACDNNMFCSPIHKTLNNFNETIKDSNIPKITDELIFQNLRKKSTSTLESSEKPSDHDTTITAAYNFNSSSTNRNESAYTYSKPSLKKSSPSSTSSTSTTSISTLISATQLKRSYSSIVHKKKPLFGKKSSAVSTKPHRKISNHGTSSSVASSHTVDDNIIQTAENRSQNHIPHVKMTNYANDTSENFSLNSSFIDGEMNDFKLIIDDDIFTPGMPGFSRR